jgi:tagatose-1,6-bisphosphate aldolase
MGSMPLPIKAGSSPPQRWISVVPSAKPLLRRRGSDASEAEVSEFKVLVTEVLTPHASAILLDPEYGLEAVKHRAKQAGVFLAYEKTGYDATIKGRLPEWPWWLDASV